jgi:8-oxo-dGTP pyrophosphatase MutT (NUDIX family)
MSFVDRLRDCSVFDRAAYIPFVVDGQDVGLVRPEFAALLAKFPDVFEVSDDEIRLAAGLAGAAARTRAVDTTLRQLAARGAIRRWRDEPYSVAAALGQPLLFLMERAAIPKFGIWASGVHVNGFVRDRGELFMWIGRRSPDKQTAPNKLDQLIAGGRPADLTIAETVVKEGEEEANVDRALASRAAPVGAISYCTERREGLRRDVLYVFDLELPRDFVPVNHDGEIAEFQLWPIRRVMETVRDTDEFKFNCALVVIDFLIRHGLLAPDDEPDYLTLVRGLRGP